MKNHKRLAILTELQTALQPYDYETQKRIARSFLTTAYKVGEIAKEYSKEIDAALKSRRNADAEAKGDPFVNHIGEFYRTKEENTTGIMITDEQHFNEVSRLKGAAKVADKAKMLNGDSDTDFNDLARRVEAVNKTMERVAGWNA